MSENRDAEIHEEEEEGLPNPAQWLAMLGEDQEVDQKEEEA